MRRVIKEDVIWSTYVWVPLFLAVLGGLSLALYCWVSGTLQLGIAGLLTLIFLFPLTLTGASYCLGRNKLLKEENITARQERLGKLNASFKKLLLLHIPLYLALLALGLLPSWLKS